MKDRDFTDRLTRAIVADLLGSEPVQVKGPNFKTTARTAGNNILLPSDAETIVLGKPITDADKAAISRKLENRKRRRP